MTPTGNDIWILMPKSVWIDPQRRDQLLVHAIAHDGLNWHTRETLDWQDFRGSQQALSSLSLPETQLILALPPCETVHPQPEDRVWAGLADSPPRLINTAHCPWHDWVSAEFQDLAASLSVCIAESVSQAVRSVPLTRVSGSELDTLTLWVQDIQAFSAKRYVQAIGLLTLRPGRTRQTLRLAGLAVAIALSVAVQALQTQQIRAQVQSAFQSMLHSASSRPKSDVPWADWQQQIAKFGQNNRANLASLQFQWRLNDPVQSTVTLARPRKRLPKGCQPITSQAAFCVAEAAMNPRFHK